MIPALLFVWFDISTSEMSATTQIQWTRVEYHLYCGKCKKNYIWKNPIAMRFSENVFIKALKRISEEISLRK